MSTRIRAISFWTFVVLVSSEAIKRRISRVLSTTRRASFSVVLCSERLASIFSSRARIARSAAATDSSAERDSSAKSLSSFFARASAASVSSCATTSLSCVSASFSFLSKTFVSAFCAFAASVSVLRNSANKRSFFRDSSRACSFFAFVSASTKSISCRCSISASRVALNASSRLASPTNADFHWLVSCFFSSVTASISAFASVNVSRAILVSFACAALCASYSAPFSWSFFSVSCKASMSTSWSSFAFSNALVSFSAANAF
mmetsp:Transcript_4006/g.15974  ORF Transcript_4006/g.15974 Transcript_4006/m.15974 type:complete len:262 (+) Transcript_4006:1499-2284(+)